MFVCLFVSETVSICVALARLETLTLKVLGQNYHPLLLTSANPLFKNFSLLFICVYAVMAAYVGTQTGQISSRISFFFIH